LEHGDLWGENVVATPDASVIIDWEEAALAHPFFTPSLLLLSLDETPVFADVAAARARIREAYLAPWRAGDGPTGGWPADRREAYLAPWRAGDGPTGGWPADRLEAAFDLAQRVAMLHYAVQFRRLSLPRIETSWEVGTFVPYFARRLLALERRA